MPSKIELSGLYRKDKGLLIKSIASQRIDCRVSIDKEYKYITISSDNEDTAKDTADIIKKEIHSIKISKVPSVSQTILTKILQSDSFYRWFENFMNDNDIDKVRLFKTEANEIAIMGIYNIKINSFIDWLTRVVTKDFCQFTHEHNKIASTDLQNYFSFLESTHYVVITFKYGLIEVEGFMPDMLLVMSLIKEKLDQVNKCIRHYFIDQKKYLFIKTFKCLEGSPCELVGSNEVCLYAKDQTETIAKYDVLSKNFSLKTLDIQNALVNIWKNNESDEKRNFEDVVENSRCIHSFAIKSLTLYSDDVKNISTCCRRLSSYITSHYQNIIFTTSIQYDAQHFIEKLRDQQVLNVEQLISEVHVCLLAENFMTIQQFITDYFTKILNYHSLNTFPNEPFKLCLSEPKKYYSYSSLYGIPNKHVHLSADVNGMSMMNAKLPYKLYYNPSEAGRSSNLKNKLANYFQSHWFNYNLRSYNQLDFELDMFVYSEIFLPQHREFINSQEVLCTTLEKSEISLELIKLMDLKHFEKLLFLPIDKMFMDQLNTTASYKCLASLSYPLVFYTNSDHAAIASNFSGKMLLCRVYMGSCHKLPEGYIYNSLKPPCVEFDKCDQSFNDGMCINHKSFDSIVLKKTTKVNNVECVYEKVLIRDVRQCLPVTLFEYKTVPISHRLCYIM